MKNHESTANVNVVLNALCYAFWQAEDYLDVVYDGIYNGPSCDDELHFLQVRNLAVEITKLYEVCSDDERKACFSYEDYIAAVAKCETLADYRKLKDN